MLTSRASFFGGHAPVLGGVVRGDVRVSIGQRLIRVRRRRRWGKAHGLLAYDDPLIGAGEKPAGGAISYQPLRHPSVEMRSLTAKGCARRA